MKYSSAKSRQTPLLFTLVALALVVGRGRRRVAAHADAQRFRFPTRRRREGKMRLCDGRLVVLSIRDYRDGGGD